MTPSEALQVLLAGNQRFMAGQPEHRNQSAQRRQDVARVQQPFAAVLCCADSRVAPEIIFDQGLGDLFVIRLAGPVLDGAVVATLEYAVEKLSTGLVVTVGHQRCGAIELALDAVAGRVQPRGEVQALVEVLRPAVAAAASSIDPWDAAVRANISALTAQIRTVEPILAGGVREARIKVVGAYYSLDSGSVGIIDAR